MTIPSFTSTLRRAIKRTEMFRFTTKLFTPVNNVPQVRTVHHRFEGWRNRLLMFKRLTRSQMTTLTLLLVPVAYQSAQYDSQD